MDKTELPISERAAIVLQLAVGESEGMKLGGRAIVLAVIQEGGSRVASIFEEAGLQRDTVLQFRIDPKGRRYTPKELGRSARRLSSQAAREAKKRGSPVVRVEHLILSLLARGEEEIMAILRELAKEDLASLRDRIEQVSSEDRTRIG
jgi:ATP-dependent Clp protease ATP-binding subunit ClpA